VILLVSQREQLGPHLSGAVRVPCAPKLDAVHGLDLEVGAHVHVKRQETQRSVPIEACAALEAGGGRDVATGHVAAVATGRGADGRSWHRSKGAEESGARQ
jgi:hypothetical protein